MIEIDVDETLDNRLFESFIFCSSFVGELYLLLEEGNVTIFELSVLDASLELLVDDLVCESS